MERSPLAADLDELLQASTGPWEGLRGARVFLTGGTGFVGTWLVESLVHASRALGLGARATILTRDEAAFRARNPHLSGAPELDFLRGDAARFELPSGRFTAVIHAAAKVVSRTGQGPAEEARGVIVGGARRTLDLAARSGASRFLLVSSGAVYGPRPPGAGPVAEDDPGASAPLTSPDPYAEAKREAERLCADPARSGPPASVARGFAFVGPHLPLDGHFAAGNFIRDALKGGPLIVNGDGTPRRSYLYASDLAAWLWTILLRGAPGRAYNVGAERSVSVAELARLTAAAASPGAEVRVARAAAPGAPVQSYLPDTRRARAELGLRETVALEDALRRTAAWARSRPS